MKKRKKINDGVKFTIIAVVLIAIFCIAITPVTLQNDTYYTIKIGEHIQNNGIDMKDQFSWHEDLNYTYPHWLYDLLTYKIYSQFGMMGIYLTTCLLSCILGITLFFVSSKISKNKLISFFVTIGAMYLLKGYIAARAQLVTFILFILSLYFIEKFLENRKIRYGIGIVLISTLIANLHVAVWPFLFILFLPYIGEYLIAVLADLIIYKKVQERLLKIKIKYSSNNKEALEKFQKELDELQAKVSKIKIKRSKSIQNPYKIKITKNKNVKWLIVIMIICAFTGLLTPLGDTPYTYLAKTMQGNTTKNINEHLPMTIAEQPEVLCTIIIFLAVLTFTKIKIKLSDLFMIGGLAFLMLESRRQLSMFSLIGSVILSKLIVELITCYDKELLEKINKKILHPFIIICMIVLVGWQTYDNVKTKYNDKFIDETQYPVKACDYILENIDLSKARFYNEYNYGSYMIYRGIPVFIDSRADLYAPEFSGKDEDIFMDFINTSNIGTFYEDTFKKYGITHIICYKNSKMNMIITKTHDPKLKELYSDNYFVVYERQTEDVTQ